MPFVEYLPHLHLNKKFQLALMNMIQLYVSISSRQNDSVITLSDNVNIIPFICYEGIYGSYISKPYIKNQSIIIGLTNENWIDSYMPSIYLNSILRIRAIENRKYLIKCGNNQSCIIDNRGIIINKTKPYSQSIINGEVGLNKKLTCYMIFGDFIGCFSSIIVLFSFIYYLYRCFHLS